MGKSNNLHNVVKNAYQRKNDLNNFLKENEIKLLENINSFFIEQFIVDFSNFIKKNVQLISYSIEIQSHNSNKNNIKNFKYVNSIEVYPYKNKSFVTFSCNFPSVITDLLFGASSNFRDEINKKEIVTSTEFWINKKIIKFITNIFSNIIRNYFSLEIKFINVKIIVDSQELNFDCKKYLLKSSFNLNIDSKKVFFNILVPLSIFKNINDKIVPLKINNEDNRCLNITNQNKIFLDDIYDVELNIISKISDISISYNELFSLSVGDVLSIEKPDKIMVFVEKKPIFTGNYKIFNKQMIVFIEKFIDPNLELNKDKEHSNE